jgi:hypothetical protein
MEPQSQAAYHTKHHKYVPVLQQVCLTTTDTKCACPAVVVLLQLQLMVVLIMHLLTALLLLWLSTPNQLRLYDATAQHDTRNPEPLAASGRRKCQSSDCHLGPVQLHTAAHTRNGFPKEKPDCTTLPTCPPYTHHSPCSSTLST